MKDIHKLRDVARSDMFPLGERTLRRLIHNGELYKTDQLPPGEEYVLGLNFGTSAQPRWYIHTQELLNWRTRKINPTL